MTPTIGPSPQGAPATRPRLGAAAEDSAAGSPGGAAGGVGQQTPRRGDCRWDAVK